MSLRKRRGFWIGLGIVVLLAAFLYASRNRSDRKGEKEVRIEKVERLPIESWVRAPGQVKPESVVQISSNVQGRVDLLEVEEGDRVRAGDLLIRLDDERYRSVADQSRARLEGAEASYQLALAQYDLAKQQLERQVNLFDQGLVSPQALEEKRTAAAVERARLEASRKEIRQVRATLEQAEKDLRETVLRAPISGVVTALNVEAGENVVTGTMNNPGTVILTLSVLDSMEVEAEVDETDVVKIRTGQTAVVLVDALAEERLDGVVTTVGQSGRRGSQSSRQGTHFLVRVRIVDPPDRLRPGMSADVEILAGKRDSVVVVPIQALVARTGDVIREWEEERERHEGSETATDPDEKTVDIAPTDREQVEGLFLDDEGVARFHRVELGLRSDTHIEVLGGATAGDHVVTGPYRTLRKLDDGDFIKPDDSASKNTHEKAGAARKRS